MDKEFVDLVLMAFFPTISEAMGPYVPLIITNCIIMGRAEAFFVQNPTRFSLLDALANGLAYAYTLMAIAIVREILGGGAEQMGQVMGQLMPRIRGRFDGKEANRVVREEMQT